MKNQIIISLILLLGSWFLPLESNSQITRGAVPGEIYLTNDWYFEGYTMHRAVFRSTDNGEHVQIQYNSTYPPQAGDMMIGKPLGDATQGALYIYGDNELWVSIDYGESWEYLENSSYSSYATGYSPGEIFRRSNYNLYRSDNYGSNFELIAESITEPLTDVGNFEGQIFGFTGTAGESYNLFHSLDNGQSFITIPIDSTIAYWAPSGKQPRISRGTDPGELYLVSWWPDYHYKIFHSIDTGYTWTEKYESGYIDLYYWGLSYTAGREPGSFYVVRSTGDPTMSHLWLYIDYSDDYGETFTTWFHEMDSTYTGIKPSYIEKIELSSAPNPFKNQTVFSFQLPKNCTKPVLSIYNVRGDLIRQYNISGKNIQQWDCTDTNGNRVNEGLYFCTLFIDGKIISTKKLIFNQ